MSDWTDVPVSEYTGLQDTLLSRFGVCDLLFVTLTYLPSDILLWVVLSTYEAGVLHGFQHWESLIRGLVR